MENKTVENIQTDLSKYASLATENSLDASPSVQADVGGSISEASRTALKTLLKPIPKYNQIEPSITILVDQDYVIVYRANGDLRKLNLSDSLWARRYIDVDTRGPKIQSMKSILEVGDLTYIERDGLDW